MFLSKVSINFDNKILYTLHTFKWIVDSHDHPKPRKIGIAVFDAVRLENLLGPVRLENMRKLGMDTVPKSLIFNILMNIRGLQT